MNDPNAAMDERCVRFLAHLHFRHELGADATAEFAEHHARCADCRVRLVEAERLDDLLLQWRPAPPSNPLAEQVQAILRANAPAASCDEFAEDIHDFVAEDLEPWRRRALEEHLSSCARCEHDLGEARELRALWQSWNTPSRRPEDSSAMADQVVRRLGGDRTEGSPETTTSSWLAWWSGGVQLPRVAAAALLLLSLAAVFQVASGRWPQGPSTGKPSSSPGPLAQTEGERPIAVQPVGYFRDGAGRFELSRGMGRAADASARRVREGFLLRDLREQPLR